MKNTKHFHLYHQTIFLLTRFPSITLSHGMPPEITYHANRCWEKQTPQSIFFQLIYWSNAVSFFTSILCSAFLLLLLLQEAETTYFASLLFRSYRCILQFLLFFNVCWWYKQLTLLVHNPGSRSTSLPKILQVLLWDLAPITSTTSPSLVTVFSYYYWLFSCSDFSQLYSSIIVMVLFQICN